jgi:membrane protease YdiL (CAAX protease family)
LVVAWGGTALLVSPAAQLLVDSSSILVRVVGQAALGLLWATVIGIVLVWERRPLESLWLRSFEWQSLVWAAVLILGHVFLLYPATEWLRRGLGLPGYAAGMEAVLVAPVWLRVFAVLTAGIVEETLFRGYAVTRLVQLSGSPMLAVILSSVVFAALHFPLWGSGPTLVFLIGGLAYTAFFAWRRDLMAMIIAHVAIDLWALVVTPGFLRWWA